MGQIVSDDFNRADAATLGANWTQDALGGASIGITSNQAKMQATNNFVLDFYSGAGWTGGADQYSELTLIAFASGTDAGPICRASGAPVSGTGSMYLFVLNDTDAAHTLGDTNYSVALYKLINASFTQLGASVTGVTISANDVIRLETQSTTITGKINGVQIVQRTDNAIATGQPGVYITNGANTTAWDPFAAGDFGAGAAASQSVSTFALMGVM